MPAPNSTHYRPIRTQSVSYTGTAGVISNGIGAGIRVVRIYATTDAHIAFGASPTATTGDMPITANEPELFTVTEGQKVSAVQQSDGGDLYVTEMSQ